jgi:hypothetical protein
LFRWIAGSSSWEGDGVTTGTWALGKRLGTTFSAALMRWDREVGVLGSMPIWIPELVVVVLPTE